MFNRFFLRHAKQLYKAEVPYLLFWSIYEGSVEKQFKCAQPYHLKLRVSLLFAGHKCSSFMNLPCYLNIDLLSGASFKHFVQNLCWTSLHDSVFENLWTQNAFSGWVNTMIGFEQIRKNQ